MGRSPKALMGIFAALAVAVLALICSFDSLEPVQYGMRYNAITKQVDEDVYHGGLHLVGFWSSFIRFPSTVTNIEFSKDRRSNSRPLKTRTKEGLSLTLYLSFQYRLIKSEVLELYRLANLNYEPVFIQNARDVILRASADYAAAEYWEEREKIGAEMLKLVQARLNRSHADVMDLQLLVIELPPKFEDSIVATQVRKQSKKSRQMQQMATTIRAETGVKVAEYQRMIKVLNQQGLANRTLARKMAEAEAAQARLEVEAGANWYAKEKLGLSSDQLVEYLRNAAILSNNNATVLMGLDSNVILNV